MNFVRFRWFFCQHFVKNFPLIFFKGWGRERVTTYMLCWRWDWCQRILLMGLIIRPCCQVANWTWLWFHCLNKQFQFNTWRLLTTLLSWDRWLLGNQLIMRLLVLIGYFWNLSLKFPSHVQRFNSKSLVFKFWLMCKIECEELYVQSIMCIWSLHFAIFFLRICKTG